jgi:hypothetical protein
MKRGNFGFELRRKLFNFIQIVLMLQGRKIPIAGWLEKTFERENVRFPGYGAFWYIVGALLLALFLSRKENRKTNWFSSYAMYDTLDRSKPCTSSIPSSSGFQVTSG